MVDLDVILNEAVPADGKDGRPASYIQWKGTELCADFHCPCGESTHICGQYGTFAYSVHCNTCDRRWHLAPRLLVREMKPGEFDPKESVVELDGYIHR